MISLELAKELKSRGLEWRPALHDFFAVPDSDLEERRFVVSDMMIDVQQLFGREIITFNGAVEWSLDNIMMVDAVWMPTESQLRGMLEEKLGSSPGASLELVCQGGIYQCRLKSGDLKAEFEASAASEVYGKALLHLLSRLD